MQTDLKALVLSMIVEKMTVKMTAVVVDKMVVVKVEEIDLVFRWRHWLVIMLVAADIMIMVMV